MRAGAIELNATDDTDRNLETADRLVRPAAAVGAELVALPETWTVIGGCDIVRAFTLTTTRDHREVLVRARAPDVETAIVAELDPEGLRKVRRSLPALAHRRPAAYSWDAR